MISRVVITAEEYRSGDWHDLSEFEYSACSNVVGEIFVPWYYTNSERRHLPECSSMDIAELYVSDKTRELLREVLTRRSVYMTEMLMIPWDHPVQIEAWVPVDQVQASIDNGMPEIWLEGPTAPGPKWCKSIFTVELRHLACGLPGKVKTLADRYRGHEDLIRFIVGLAQ